MVTATTAPRRLCGLDRESYIRVTRNIAFANYMNSRRDVPYTEEWFQAREQAMAEAEKHAGDEFDRLV